MTASVQMLVKVKLSFPGLHSYSRANADVQYLRSQHRHMFYFELTKRVRHDNRDIEFITFRQQVTDFMNSNFSVVHGHYDFGELSCESLAIKLFNEYDLEAAWVFEDNENGGGIERCG